MPTTVQIPEQVVSQWIAAFNRRNLDAMLARLDRDVCFHPLRVVGMAACYEGHDGIRRWFAELSRQKHRHSIELSDVSPLEDGWTLAAGRVVVERLPGTPFSGLYEIDGEAIVSAHHYFSPVEILGEAGLLESMRAPRAGAYDGTNGAQPQGQG